MLSSEALDNVRVVSQSTRGSTVSNSLVAYDDSDSFPIQYALGFDLAQTYFGRIDHLVVEGWSDYYYLTGIADLLAAGGESPNQLSRISILPAIGASKVTTVAGYSLSNGHRVRVLVDADAEGQRARALLQAQGVLPSNSVLDVSVADDSDTIVTIEDVLGEQLFKRLVKEAYSAETRDFPDIKLKPGSTLVDRVSAAYEELGLRISKNRVAKHFLNQVDAGTLQVPAKTRARFMKLIEAILTAPSHRRA